MARSTTRRSVSLPVTKGSSMPTPKSNPSSRKKPAHSTAMVPNQNACIVGLLECGCCQTRLLSDQAELGLVGGSVAVGSGVRVRSCDRDPTHQPEADDAEN